MKLSVLFLALIGCCFNAIIDGKSKHCSINCGSIQPTSIQLPNRSCVQKDYRFTNHLQITWNDNTVSSVTINYSIDFNAVELSAFGTGVITDGRFVGLNASVAYNLRDVSPKCFGCYSDVGVTHIDGLTFLYIGAKGSGQWLKCRGVANTFYSPGLTAQPSNGVTSTQAVDYTDCFGSC